MVKFTEDKALCFYKDPNGLIKCGQINLSSNNGFDFNSTSVFYYNDMYGITLDNITMTYTKQYIIIGDLKDSKINGYGIIHKLGNKLTKGEFKDSLLNGQAIVISNEEIKEGFFENDELKELKIHCVDNQTIVYD